MKSLIIIFCAILIIPVMGQDKWTIKSDTIWEVKNQKDTLNIVVNEDGILIESETNPIFNQSLEKGIHQIFIDGNNLEFVDKSYVIDRGKSCTIVDTLNRTTLTIRFSAPDEIQKELDVYKYPILDVILLFSTKNQDSISLILKKYNVKIANPNVYLVDYVQKLGLMKQSTQVIDSKSPLKGIGGLDVTKYADGIAKFLVKRSKEELSVAFFRRFQDILKDDKNKDFQDLFPQTKATLELIDTEIYNYQQYISVLREQFEQDLKLLPEHFSSIIDNHKEYFEDKHDLRAVIDFSSTWAKGLRDDVHPGDILADMDLIKHDSLDVNTSGTIKTIQMLSQALRNSSPEPYWVDKSKIKEIISDSKKFKVFLGLIYEEVKLNDIQFRDQSFIQILDSIEKDYENRYTDFKRYFSSLINKTQTLNKIISAYEGEEDLSFERALQYTEVTTGLLSSLLDWEGVFTEELPDYQTTKNQLQAFLKILSSSSRMILDVNYKKYGAAIMEAVNLYKLTTIIEDKEKDGVGQSKLLIKYGAFIAAMTQAEDSDDVAAAIETFALPSGSSSIKRESTFSVSLNSYVGIQKSWEKPNGIDTSSTSSFWNITSPIGIGVHFGNIGGDKGFFIRSIGAQFNLIDIGAITAFRFNNDSLDVPNIYLKEIISPGFIASLGFKNLPISLNFSWQLAPKLRRIEMTENEVDLQYYSRYGISLAVDIPLMNIYTKPRE